MLVTSKVGINEMYSVFVRLPDKWPLCLNYSMLVKPNKLCLFNLQTLCFQVFKH